MRKLILTTLLLAMTAGAMYASDSVSVKRAVYFDVDVYQLSPTVRQQLDSMAQALKDQGEFALSIYGTTDVDGSEGYNQKLSERRAKAVQDYLMAKDIKAVRCMTRGLGKKGDQLSKAENRKVDIEVTLTYFSNVNEVFRSLAQNTDQRFTINPNTSNEIKCKNNTTISIPAQAMLLPNGEKPKGKVTLTVREALSMEDFLTQDLSSVSDGKLLESRGMIYIDATADGQKLNIDTKNAVSIAIPATNTEKGMKLFYGERNADKTMNWKVANSEGFNPAPKTVPIDIDRSSLRGMYIADRTGPNMPDRMNDVILPAKPSKPRVPLALPLPVRGDLYHASTLEKIFFRKRIKAKNEELYQQAQKKYDESLERSAAYQTKMKEYEVALKVYDEQMKTFEAEGKKRLEEARTYFKKMYEYVAAGSINSLVRTVEMIPITNKTVLTNHERASDNYPQNQHQQLRQILGDVYYHYYHYDDVNSYIKDIDYRSNIDDDKGVFYVNGYDRLYDSIYRSTHIDDTLRMLQGRILQRAAELGLLNDRNVTNYVAAVNQLGWINCDRFTETPASQLVNVRIKEDQDVKMYMVFSDINSCLPISRGSGTYVSSSVPAGKDVRIVAIKVEDGKPRLAVAKVNTSDRTPVTLQYKTCSLSEIKSNFASLPHGG